MSNALSAAVLYWGVKFVLQRLDPTPEAGTSEAALKGFSDGFRARLAGLEGRAPLEDPTVLPSSMAQILLH